MNKIIMAAIVAGAVAGAIGAEAAEDADYPAESIESLIEASGWTKEELFVGLNRLDRLYQNDMATEAGRVRWHGKAVRTEIDTNACVKVVTYLDGETYTEPFRAVSAAASVKAANAKLNYSTNGVPAALARIRARTAANKGVTNEVTTVIHAGQ